MHIVTSARYQGFGRAGEPGGQHYDPSQPRVPAGDASHHGGQWTNKGGVTLASSALPVTASSTLVFDPRLAPALRDALSRMAAAAVSPLIVLGHVLMIPLSRNRVVEGELTDDPDIRYRYDRGYLSVSQILPSGEALVLFHGLPDRDGIYVHADGTVIGRELDSGVFLNKPAVERKTSRPAVAGVAARTKDRPKFCPDPGPDWPNNNSEDWKEYQEQITGLPRGLAIEYNGYKFDGCDETREVMLEAKARYAQFLGKNGSGWRIGSRTKKA